MSNIIENQPIDYEFLKKIIGDDEEFEKELFNIFIDSSKYNISKLEKAILSNDNNSWFMASHAMKGSSASIGAFSLSKALEVAQKISDDNSDKKIESLDNIKQEFERVHDFIKKKLG